MCPSPSRLSIHNCDDLTPRIFVLHAINAGSAACHGWIKHNAINVMVLKIIPSGEARERVSKTDT
jgi:hypothetical protein